jgi:hypothetical protein
MMPHHALGNVQLAGNLRDGRALRTMHPKCPLTGQGQIGQRLADPIQLLRRQQRALHRIVGPQGIEQFSLDGLRSMPTYVLMPQPIHGEIRSNPKEGTTAID